MLEVRREHIGTFHRNVEELGFKTLVITGPIQGKKDVRFGRLIQVRKKSGAFGSDTVLIREPDGTLQSYHNMGFFSIKEEFLPLYELEMKEVDNKIIDTEETEYNITGKNPAKGFIVNGLDDTEGETYICTIRVTE
jgi:hypothetical protein